MVVLRAVWIPASAPKINFMEFSSVFMCLTPSASVVPFVCCPAASLQQEVALQQTCSLPLKSVACTDAVKLKITSGCACTLAAGNCCSGCLTGSF